MTETCWEGQITCNGAQDSSWQRGRQAISRSISSKESNRSIIFWNLSRKIPFQEMLHYSTHLQHLCINWSNTRMNLKTCFLYFFSSRCFGNHIAKSLSWGILSFSRKIATLPEKCTIPQRFILNYLPWFKFIDLFRLYFPPFFLQIWWFDLFFWFYFFTPNQYSTITFVDTYDSTLAHLTQERESASPMIRRQYIIWTYLSSKTSIQI